MSARRRTIPRAQLVARLTDLLETLADVGKSEADEHRAHYAVGYVREGLIGVLRDMGQNPRENPAVIAQVERSEAWLAPRAIAKAGGR